MIIWSEKQYQSFLRKSGMQEPTTEKAETPKIEPVSQPIATKPVAPVQIVGSNNWTKPICAICLTIIAVVGMVHEKPSDAQVAPVKIERVAKPVHHAKRKHHRRKKCHCDCKKVVDNGAGAAMDSYIENAKGN